MDLLGWGAGFVFGTLYGGLVFGIALVAAIPYGAWQGIKRLTRRNEGESNGDARTGS
ncbi:MAG: hypothetical protein L6Q80_03815 [Dehalococcoidia bacterium]|nr:hypothetical protein [Dehalococcoidia bacterium]